MRLALTVAGAVLAADQLTKAAVVAGLPVGGGFAVVPGLLNIVHVLNRGAAFGLLNNPGQTWQTWLFSLAAVVAMALILRLLAQADDRRMSWGLALILGGAAGNLADRLRLGHVVDFVDIHYRTLHWPAFNVADAAICVGAGLVLWASMGKAHVPGSH